MIAIDAMAITVAILRFRWRLFIDLFTGTGFKHIGKEIGGTDAVRS